MIRADFWMSLTLRNILNHLKDWKEKCEIYYLREKPHLKSGPYRRKKILGKGKTIRG